MGLAVWLSWLSVCCVAYIESLGSVLSTTGVRVYALESQAGSKRIRDSRRVQGLPKEGKEVKRKGNEEAFSFTIFSLVHKAQL